MATADYTYRYNPMHNILAIEDKGGAKSLTNDIEAVLTEIFTRDAASIKRGVKIMYRDSMGIWDEVRIGFLHTHQGEVFTISNITFHPLTETDYEKALIKLANKK